LNTPLDHHSFAKRLTNNNHCWTEYYSCMLNDESLEIATVCGRMATFLTDRSVETFR